MGIKKRVVVYGLTSGAHNDLLGELNKSEFFEFQSPSSINHYIFLESSVPSIYTAEYQLLLLELDSEMLPKTSTELKSLFLNCNFERRIIMAFYGEDNEKNQAVMAAHKLLLKEDQYLVYSPTLMDLSLQIASVLIVQNETKEHSTKFH